MSSKSDYLQIIKESFDPKLINALFKNFTDQYIALLELIDNAVDDMIEGKTLYVAIDITEKITIKNRNGKGMDIDGLMNFFKWGGSSKAKRIGRYGQGGKAALGYLAKSFKIKSHPMKSEDGYLVRVDDWQDREAGFKEFKIEPFRAYDQEVGSVIIEISNLRKTIKEDTLIKRIREIYRPLIIKSKVEFYVNGDKVECLSSSYDERTKEIFTKDFKLDNNHYNMSGEYGLVSDSSAPRGGFNVYQFGRKVAKKEYFGHIDPSKRWNVERLYGELYIDFEVPLLMNKTDIDRDSAVWKKINNVMHEEIDPIMREAIDYKAPTKKEKKPLKKFSRRLKKKEGKKDLIIELTNYGPNLLFKVDKNKDDETVIKINRSHKAYNRWNSTAAGRELYLIMMYSLYCSIRDMSKKDASKFLTSFSNSLKEHSRNLL